jgi:AcrR family transcriptional regulator
MPGTPIHITRDRAPSKGRRGKQRRRRIFQSLHDCILAKGYVRTTLADIAEAADMTPSHLLYYFKGKEDILAQYFQNVAVRFLNRLEEITAEQGRHQVLALADFWFRGETSTKQEIGFMLECFGAAVHDEALKVTKAEFDVSCKEYLKRIFEDAPKTPATGVKDAAELAYAMMIGLRSAVYFDDAIGLEEAHRLFRRSMLSMCGYDPST